MKIYNTPFSIENNILIKSLKQELMEKLGVYAFDNFFIDEDGCLYYYIEDFYGITNNKEFITRDKKYIELFKAIKTLDKYIY
jgi:hypothetical protein